MKRDYPQAPIPAVGVIIQEDDRLVLIQRGKEPFKGLWTFPGGAVELGERVEDAARREAREETGLDVQLSGLALVVDNVVCDGEGCVSYHYVILDYYAHPVGGVLRPGSDAWDARWVRLEDLAGLQLTEVAGQVARELLTAKA